MNHAGRSRNPSRSAVSAIPWQSRILGRLSKPLRYIGLVHSKNETMVNVDRRKSPVFVLGCPRSGTTLLYHMLLSAGGFAVYRAETHVFDLLAPRFGNLATRADCKRLLEAWLQTEYFRRTGLPGEEFSARVLSECHSGGDFLRLLIESIAEQQGARRWAECTPEHLLYTREIRKALPNALVIHVIRDGRDVAMSLAKQGWIRPFAWDSGRGLLVAGLYWRWLVDRGRELGRELGSDYLEVRFEELNAHPRETLAAIEKFIGQALDYDSILRNGIGSVSEPNTSFGGDGKQLNPVGRWRNLPPAELAELEAVLSHSLRELNYEGTAAGAPSLSLAARGNLYSLWFSAKLWLKSHTPLSRSVDTLLPDLPPGGD